MESSSGTERPDLQTLKQRLERIEQSVERWRRKPASRRQRLILAGYRRAASELRRQVAASPEVVTRGAAGRTPETGTYMPPTPYRVFRVIQNPAAGSQTGERRLARAALRVVKE